MCPISIGLILRLSLVTYSVTKFSTMSIHLSHNSRALGSLLVNCWGRCSSCRDACTSKCCWQSCVVERDGQVDQSHALKKMAVKMSLLGIWCEWAFQNSEMKLMHHQSEPVGCPKKFSSEKSSQFHWKAVCVTGYNRAVVRQWLTVHTHLRHSAASAYPFFLYKDEGSFSNL